MKLASADNAVREILISKHLPMHYYVFLLQHALTAIEELHFDLPGVVPIKTEKLTLNDYYAVDLPEDYIDWTKVGIKAGDKILIAGVNESLNRTKNTDVEGNIIPWPDCDIAGDSNALEKYGGYFFYNAHYFGIGKGGRLFGYGGGKSTLSFKVLRERAQIQFDNDINVDEIFLEYVATTFDSESMTDFHPYIKEAVKAYAWWKWKESKDDRNVMYYRNEYFNERRIATARLKSTNIKSMVRALEKHKKQTVKI